MPPRTGDRHTESTKGPTTLASLAGSIASNITEGRKGNLAPDSKQEQSEPDEEQLRTPVIVAEDDDSNVESLELLDESVDTDVPTSDDEEPEHYTLQDFMTAADLDEEQFGQRVRVKVPGEDGEQEITYSDLVNGYKWDKTNTQRAQEIAETRKRLDATFADVVESGKKADAVIEHQMEQIQAEADAIEDQYKLVDWASLREQPGAMADVNAQFEQARNINKGKREKLEEVYLTYQDAQKESVDKIKSEFMAEAREKLPTIIPEWKDEQRRLKESREVGQYAISALGFTPDEVGNTIDPRIWKLVRDSWMLSQARSRTKISDKKVKTLPKNLRPGVKRSNKGQDVQTRVTKMRSRLRGSGKAVDLAALVHHNLQEEKQRNR